MSSPARRHAIEDPTRSCVGLLYVCQPAHQLTARADDAAIEACRTRLIAEKEAIASLLLIEPPSRTDDLEVMS